MKKLFFILMAVMSCVSIESFAQEVRGVETRIVIYEGSEYRRSYSSDKNIYDRWAAFEFTNLNSITVSVDATLHHTKAGVRSKKSFVLQPGESYRWKHEQESTLIDQKRSDYSNFKIYDKSVWIWENYYYVEYKAFKLQ